MRGLISTILILWGLTCFAQGSGGSLKGHITAEGQPLELASAVLLKTNFAANTDTLGNFVFKGVPAGKYQLKISFVSYENFQQEVIIKEGNATEVKADLIPLTSKLKELVVTGTLKEVKKLESVMPVDVYTTKYFQRNPTTNIWDALASVTGVFPDIDNGVSNTTDIQINGLDGNYTMILIDGVPAMNGLAGTYALNAFPMSIIDKIEVLKGASSTLYGSEAISGVINIKTKNPGNAPRFTANVMLNSMLDANADVSASFKLKKVSTLLSIGGESSNYRWDMNNDNFTDIPLVNRINFFNKWSINRPDNKIANFYARYLFEDRFGGEMQLPSIWRGSKRYYGEAVTTNQWQTGFQYQFPVKTMLLLQGDYSEHYQHAYYGTNYFSGTQRSGFLQLSWSKKVDNINELLLGATYRANYYTDNTGLSNDSLTGLKKLIHLAGAFLEDELSLGKNHKFILGVRFDYNTRTGPIATPRINYKWNSTDEKNVVRFGIGTGYRVPNLLNEGFGALNGSRQIFIAEQLNPETALSTSCNYTRVQTLNGGILNIDANVFYTYFFNFIDPDYHTDPTLIIYANNTHGAMASGFSVNADFTFNYPLKVGFGFTYSNVFQYDIDDNGKRGKEIPLHSPPFTANFFLSYNFPVPQLSLDVTGVVVSPMLLATVPNDFRPSKSPWFIQPNIQMTKKFNNGLEIYLGLKNIFNFIQKDPILRPFDPFNRQLNVNNPFGYRFDTTYGFTTTQGINAFLGLRYTFQ